VVLIDWLRDTCAAYAVEPIAIFRRAEGIAWPLTIADESALMAALDRGGYFLPLPTEPAALANVIEVSLVNFLISKLNAMPDVKAVRGTERGYPDVEVSGEAFGGSHHAVDIKVARRAANGKSTQSRITLYTGNTFFMYPSLHWPGTFRRFGDYASHVDVLAIYTLNRKTNSRIDNFELIVQEPWRIASQQRSSTTREYLGAVKSLDDLRNGRGEFKTEAEFYRFWRGHNFKIGKVVQKQLQRLLSAQGTTGSNVLPKRRRKG
jgi:hypothetical protein